MATEPKSLPGYTEHSIVVPDRLWNRVEQYADETAREPSEVVADALRMLVTGITPSGMRHPVAGHAETKGSGERDGSGPAGRGNVELVLAEVRDEPLASDAVLTHFQRAAEIVDRRDGFSGSHSRAVADLALELAGTTGLTEDDRRVVELAALGHDFGKTRVPDEILGKQGPLSADEWATVKQYPEFGYEILSGHQALEPVRDLILAHQERWDGSGYPRGLAADEIPVGAQIIGLCDVYMVLTSDRAYRPAMPAEAARDTIEAGAGRLWNPEFVRLLLDKAKSR